MKTKAKKTVPAKNKMTLTEMNVLASHSDASMRIPTVHQILIKVQDQLFYFHIGPTNRGAESEEQFVTLELDHLSGEVLSMVSEEDWPESGAAWLEAKYNMVICGPVTMH